MEKSPETEEGLQKALTQSCHAKEEARKTANGVLVVVTNL